MIANRYVRLPIRIGAWQRMLYFYESHTGLWDSQLHWQYSRGMRGTLQDAVSEFVGGIDREHHFIARGLMAELGQPVETNWCEVSQVRAAIRQFGDTHPYFRGP